MTDKEKAKYDEMARILKAIAHPSRMFIIDKLNEREHCVCELQKMIGADISTVSKHLSVLKNVGILGVEKRGNQVFYNLKCSCVLSFYSCVTNVMKQNAEEQMKLIEE